MTQHKGVINRKEIEKTLTDLKSAFEHDSPALTERTRTLMREAYFIIVALTASFDSEEPKP